MKRLVLTLSILLGFALGGVAQSLFFDFEDGTLQGWTTLDADGDGHCWEPSIGGMGHNSNGMVMAYSKDYATGDSLTPNEYLVSPRLVLNEDWPVIRFYACALDEIYPAEHFAVAISTTVNNDPLAFTTLYECTLTAKDAGNRQGNWYNYTVDLSAYTGQEVYVAIRHHYCSGQSAICIDDIQIEGDIVVAQYSLWKPIRTSGILLGANSDGSLFAHHSWSGIARSQDEGETWQIVLGYETGYNYYFNENCFGVSPEGRVFVFEDNPYRAWFSDDNGDTWEHTSEIPLNGIEKAQGLYVSTNDIMVGWTDNNSVFWTVDGGATWGSTILNLDENHQVSDMIVKADGDVYAGINSFGGEGSGIFHSTLSDMQNWTLAAFEGAAVQQMVLHPDGSIVAGTFWGEISGFQHEPGFYLIDAMRDEIAISDNGVTYCLDYYITPEEITFVLAYSGDYGEHLQDVGESFEIAATGGGRDGYLYKGYDNYLYLFVNGQYYKSVRDADHILNQDNTHYVDAIQICGTDGQTQFPLTVNVENAESGPNYGCLYLQPNPSWFFVKMEESGDVILQISAQSNGRFYDIDFCCWGPFNALPENSEELTQDKVVDCSYNSTVPITCTIPSEAQTGEYYVLVVTNYANMPGDLIFTIVGGTGSLECPGTHQREWYYEIQNENGSITYQYMYQAGDTIVNDEPTHILVKINTLYDKDIHTEETHEYVYERDGKLYWWNKTLEEFTVLYDYEAEVGDSWEIKVGTRALDMHVDAVEEIEYEGRAYRMLRVSDPEDLFSGNIVCGIGHLTSFFPERLMDNGDGLRVEGLRCYWIEDELVFKPGDEDCDAIYSEVHGIEEGGPSTPSTPSTGSGTVMVYPNPTDGVLVIETHDRASLQGDTYRISNMMGQVLLQGQIMGETQRIDVSSLPQGMYFITVGEGTRKFVVNR